VSWHIQESNFIAPESTEKVQAGGPLIDVRLFTSAQGGTVRERLFSDACGLQILPLSSLKSQLKEGRSRPEIETGIECEVAKKR
jgi:hypothetical protein